jgi:3-methyladenine DNA glycosylase AlkD
MDKDVILLIRRELKQQVDDKTKRTFQSFFKESVTAYGVKTAVVTKIAKQYFIDMRLLGKVAIFSLCEELLTSDYNEEAFIAFKWVQWLGDEYEPGDFTVFEEWLRRYVNNWAKCDTLCNHPIGTFIERYPQYLSNLKRWTTSKNRWLRRASAVSLVIPAKRGKFLEDIFEIANSLLLDKDDLVRKGYGWMLKEASIAHQEEVLNYVLQNKSVMPRTALRYAIERMPKELRHLAMGKSREV